MPRGDLYPEFGPFETGYLPLIIPSIGVAVSGQAESRMI
jgi:hypothetical protein